jgi:hypothetical protein
LPGAPGTRPTASAPATNSFYGGPTATGNRHPAELPLKIDHARLLDALGSFPARGMIQRWLKAGVIAAGVARAE